MHFHLYVFEQGFALKSSNMFKEEMRFHYISSSRVYSFVLEHATYDDPDSPANRTPSQERSRFPSLHISVPIPFSNYRHNLIKMQNEQFPISFQIDCFLKDIVLMAYTVSYAHVHHIIRFLVFAVQCTLLHTF